ncbi:hypothetical protein NKH77_45955 [Streptomyces sp. M19]
MVLRGRHLRQVRLRPGDRGVHRRDRLLPPAGPARRARPATAAAAGPRRRPGRARPAVRGRARPARRAPGPRRALVARPGAVRRGGRGPGPRRRPRRPRRPLAGYAVYRAEAGNSLTGAPGTIEVYELEAEDPAVAAALWTYLASIDLTGRVVAWVRPPDDPLLLFAADRDRVRVTRQYPALWLRLVDVRAALTARSWAAPWTSCSTSTTRRTRQPRPPAPHGRARRRRLRAHRRPARPDPGRGELAACYLGGTRRADWWRPGWSPRRPGRGRGVGGGPAHGSAAVRARGLLTAHEDG